MSKTISELEQELLGKVYAAAVDVSQWDYEDLDAEPKKDLETLKAAVGALEKLAELKDFAAN